MLGKIKEFGNCTRGNVAFMTAGAILPLLTLAIGGIEISEHSRVKNSMQSAADDAVLSAFKMERGRINWAKNIRYANGLFDANFSERKRVGKVRRKLSGRQTRRKIQLTYEASAEMTNLFGNINPLAGNKVTVKSSAIFDPYSGRAPRLTVPPKASVKR